MNSFGRVGMPSGVWELDDVPLIQPCLAGAQHNRHDLASMLAFAACTSLPEALLFEMRHLSPAEWQHVASRGLFVRPLQSSDDGDLLMDTSFITSGGATKVPLGSSPPSVHPPRVPSLGPTAAEGTPAPSGARCHPSGGTASAASGSTPLTIPLAGVLIN